MSIGDKTWTDAGTRTITDKAGFSLSAAAYEEVWRNIDTLNVDTSLIGEWLGTAPWDAPGNRIITGLTANAIEVGDIQTNAINADALATDAVAEVSDGVWNEDTTGHYNVGTYGLEATTGGAASITAADMGQIGDSAAQRVWNHLADTAWGAGSMGDSAKGWGATGSVTAQNMADIADSVLAHKDTAWASGTFGDQVLDMVDTTNAILDTLQLWDTKISYLDATISSRSTLSTSDNIGINWADITNAGSSVGLNATTIATVTTVTGGATSANQTLIIDSVNALLDTLQNQDDWAAHQTSVDSVLDSTNLNYLRPTVAGRTLDVETGGEVGINLNNALGDLAGDNIENGAISASKLDASTYYTIAGVVTDTTFGRDTAAAYAVTTGMGRFIKDSTQGAAGSLDSAVVQRITNRSTSDTLTALHGSGSWAAGAGSGANTVVIWVIDTSGTDDTTSGVNVTVYSAAGTRQGTVQKSNDSGFVKFSLDDGVYSILAENNNYYFSTISATVAGASGVDTLSISGYDRTVASPSDPSLANVTIDLTKIGGRTGMNLYGLQVCAYNEIIALDAHGVDTVGGSKVVLPESVCETTDSLGRATLSLIKSCDYADTTRGFYRIVGMRGTVEVFKYESLYLTGDINLGDSLRTR